MRGNLIFCKYYTNLGARKSRSLSYEEDDDMGHYDRAYSRQFNAQRLRLDQPDIVLPNMSSGQAPSEKEIVNRNENPYYGSQDNTETSASNFDMVQRTENPYYGNFTT